jgi:tripartite-type tricarboxylate transporter receptor subunit TctC
MTTASKFKKSLLPVTCAGVIAATLAALSGSTLAQSWPVKPVRLVVPISAGGSVDTIGRAVAQKYSEIWKQPVIVENRAGAGGTIGTDYVAKSAADGYTLLINSTSQASSAALYRKLPFDVVRDFAAVTQIITTYQMLVSSPKLAVTSVKELIAYAKANPGKLNMASTGTGSSPHLVGELLRLEAGIDVVHVPYKGDAALQPALIAGEVHFSFLPPNAAVVHMKAGRMRVLAVTGTTRGAIAPDVPTMIEAGIPNFEFTGWVGIFAPAGTPRDIQVKIAEDMGKLLAMPDIAERVPVWGGVAAGTMPDDFNSRYRNDVAKFARIVKEAKVPLIDQ